jgi:AraC-like DNA-binding protein
MVEFIFGSLKTLYFIAVFQALLIAFFLIIQRRGNKVNRIILVILLMNFILFLTASYILLYMSNWKHVYYAHLVNLTVFLASPVLYLYYQSLLDNNFRFRFVHIYHALPFIAIFSFIFYTIVLKYNPHFVFTPYGVTLLILLFIQSIFYLWIILKRNNGFIFHDSKNYRTRWFGHIFLSTLVIFCLKLVIFITWNMFGLRDICIFFTGMFFILSFIIINMMVLFGLYNPEILIQYFKYQNSPVDDTFKAQCFAEIQTLFISSKIYLDPLLTLDRLAKKMNVSERILSQVINECAGKNFNDFINHYRINEAKSLIIRNSYTNILTVAYEVGFNSKSTFNTAFKKFTHMTPTEFRRSVA